MKVNSLQAHQLSMTVLHPLRTAAMLRPVPMLAALVLAPALRAQVRACQSASSQTSCWTPAIACEKHHHAHLVCAKRMIPAEAHAEAPSYIHASLTFALQRCWVMIRSRPGAFLLQAQRRGAIDRDSSGAAAAAARLCFGGLSWREDRPLPFSQQLHRGAWLGQRHRPRQGDLELRGSPRARCSPLEAALQRRFACQRPGCCALLTN